MKTSQWRRAVENRCVYSARLKALSDRSGDRSAGGRRFHVADPLTAKLCCPVAVRARRTSWVTSRCRSQMLTTWNSCDLLNDAVLMTLSDPSRSMSIHFSISNNSTMVQNSKLQNRKTTASFGELWLAGLCSVSRCVVSGRSAAPFSKSRLSDDPAVGQTRPFNICRLLRSNVTYI